MGELEGRSRRLSRRARRLEEAAELDKLVERQAAERDLRAALDRLTTAELEAMRDYFEQGGEREEWTEEDAPLMRRLLEIREEVRHEKTTGDFPWRAEMQKERP